MKLQDKLLQIMDSFRHRDPEAGETRNALERAVRDAVTPKVTVAYDPTTKRILASTLPPRNENHFTIVMGPPVTMHQGAP